MDGHLCLGGPLDQNERNQETQTCDFADHALISLKKSQVTSHTTVEIGHRLQGSQHTHHGPES
jgi:hypothetical protein